MCWPARPRKISATTNSTTTTTHRLVRMEGYPIVRAVARGVHVVVAAPVPRIPPVHVLTPSRGHELGGKRRTQSIATVPVRHGVPCWSAS